MTGQSMHSLELPNRCTTFSNRDMDSAKDLPVKVQILDRLQNDINTRSCCAAVPNTVFLNYEEVFQVTHPLHCTNGE